MTTDPYTALKPFADFADPRRSVLGDFAITQGSPLAKRQLTMADCYAAADCLAARPSQPQDDAAPAPPPPVIVHLDLVLGPEGRRWSPRRPR